MKETKCPVCKVICSGALWCPLASDDKCPLTTVAYPTPEMREKLRMDEDAPRSQNR